MKKRLCIFLSCIFLSLQFFCFTINASDCGCSQEQMGSFRHWYYHLNGNGKLIEVGKYAAYMACQIRGLVYSGSYDNLIKNAVTYRETKGTGDTFSFNSPVEDSSGKITIPEELIDLVGEYLDSLKNSSDGSVKPYEFQWVKTNTNRKVWEDYYQAYESLYSFSNPVGDYDNFLKLYSDQYALNPLVFNNTSLHPKEPGMLCVVPERNGVVAVYAESHHPYPEIDKKAWLFCLGSWDFEKQEWCVSFKMMHDGGGFSDLDWQKATIRGSDWSDSPYYDNGALCSFSGTRDRVSSDFNKNSYQAYPVTADGYLQCLGTPDGGYIRVFRTTEDAKAYYNATQAAGVTLPNYPYTGGNVTIINGDVNYTNGDKDLSPDGPGGTGGGIGIGSGGSGFLDSFLTALEKLGNVILGILGKLVSFLADAIKIITEGFSSVLDLLSNGFVDFLVGAFPFLPKEWFTAIGLAMCLMLLGVVIKMFGK